MHILLRYLTLEIHNNCMVHNDVTNCWKRHCKGIFIQQLFSHTWSKHKGRNITSGCSFSSCSPTFPRLLRPLYIPSHNTTVSAAEPHQPSSWYSKTFMCGPLEGAGAPLKPTLWLPLDQQLYIKRSQEVLKATMCLARKWKRTRYFHMLGMKAKGKLCNLRCFNSCADTHKPPGKFNTFVNYCYKFYVH